MPFSQSDRSGATSASFHVRAIRSALLTQYEISDQSDRSD